MDLKKLTEKIKELPTLSSVVDQINTETEKESLTAKSLGTIISKDPALTSKILHLSNSAYYGLAKQVDTLDRGITVLGLSTIKSLALSISIYKYFGEDKDKAFDLKGLWYHSLGCAVAAKNLASVVDPKLDEQAFVSGLIHDVGKIAIAQYLPEEMAHILEQLKDTNLEQSKIEEDILGFTHQKIGGILADTWNFPDEYITAIKYHHGNFPKRIEKENKQATIIRAVLIGNQIAKAMKYGKSTDQSPAKIPLKTWNFLGITHNMVPRLKNQIKADYEKIIESWNLE